MPVPRYIRAPPLKDRPLAQLLAWLRAGLGERYQIERELRRGGMAIVFLARDLQHDRLVALKVLRLVTAATMGTTRFRHEIEIASRLQHPHILPLYDSGEAGEGLLYYVMPYVAGDTLRDRLTRERRLPLDEALRIAREVADALAYAHAQNVVHRDIKPENILFSEGRAMVADFGIARAIRRAAGDRATHPDAILGTPAYMSPEQLRGDPDVDGRSDVYSLGCVLYEMVTGAPPLGGRTTPTTLKRRLTQPAPSLRTAVPAMPTWVSAAVARALAAKPADRYTAQELVRALSAPSREEGAPAESGPERFAELRAAVRARAEADAAEPRRRRRRVSRRDLSVALVALVALAVLGAVAALVLLR